MHTNNTAHYNLPQFIGSDIPNPLTDWNDSMQDIDTAMYEIKTQADEIGSDIVDDEADIDDLQSQANLTDDNITLLNQQTTAARSAATDAQDAANRNAANITTLQQSVTNNRTSITQYNNRFNQNVPFAFGIEEVEDPDSPGTMIEKYGYYTNDDPAEFVPFNELSPNSLMPDTQENVQVASSSTTVNKSLTVKPGSYIVITVGWKSSASTPASVTNPINAESVYESNPSTYYTGGLYAGTRIYIYKATNSSVSFTLNGIGDSAWIMAYKAV